MKKYILIIGILLCCGTCAFAQMGKKPQQNKAIAIGIKGGLNLPRMLYFHNAALSRLPQAFTFSPMGGLFVDVPLGELLSLSPEVMYLTRGTDISYDHHTSGAKVHYTISASFVDFRLPVELRWPLKPYFQPYLMAGAEVGMRLGGQIHIDRTEPIALDATLDVGNANMALIHAGAFAGLGIHSRIGVGSRNVVLKLSVSIHQGLLDNYSASEHQGSAEATNVNAYQVTGMRLPQGLEACLGIAIPLERKLEDACAAFSNDRYRRHSSRGRLVGF